MNAGSVTGINLTANGSGYITTGGIKKFQDGLPVLCDPTAGWDALHRQQPGPAHPDRRARHHDLPAMDTAEADYYVIAVVQHRERMSSSLPLRNAAARVRAARDPGERRFSKHVALQTDLLDGTSVPTLMPDGSQAVAVDDPHFLGPVIVAQQGPGGPDRVLQPAADRRGRRPVPAGRLHDHGLGHGPDGHD